MAFSLTIDVPEPFRTALARGALRESADAEATTPAALFGRGLIRMALGGQRNAGRGPTLKSVCLIWATRVDWNWRSWCCKSGATQTRPVVWPRKSPRE